MAALAASACDPLEVKPVSDVLRASAQLALAGSAAMTSIAGEGPPCVTMEPACTAAPCAARVEVEISEVCPLALGSGDGVVILDGSWADANTGTFTPDLTEAIAAADGSVSLGIGAIVLTRDDDKVTVTFATQGASVDEDGGDAEPEAGVDLDAYVVDVTLGGTPSDPKDDALDISGGGQSVDGADITQVAVVGTRTDPGCRTNPVEGTATFGEVGEEGVANTTLSFHEDCDGAAEILTSTSAPLSIGETVPLDL
jgi:hypothetical protein